MDDQVPNQDEVQPPTTVEAAAGDAARGEPVSEQPEELRTGEPSQAPSEGLAGGSAPIVVNRVASEVVVEAHEVSEVPLQAAGPPPQVEEPPATEVEQPPDSEPPTERGSTSEQVAEGTSPTPLEPSTSEPAPVASEAEGEPPGEGGDERSMMELLLEESEYLPGQVAAGDVVEGIIVRKDKEQLVLDIGTKQQAVVPISDLVRLPREYLDSLAVGQRVSVVVVRPEWREGEILVSIYQARAMADWQRAEALQHSGEIVELPVVGFNKGGVLLEFGQLQGFVPRSHLATPAGSEEETRDAFSQLSGTRIPVRVIEVNRRRRRLIMSHRQALRQWRADRKRALIADLREGTILRGRVSSVADFGAFVDLGGADGLIHLSELTYQRGKHPRDVVQVGQEVDVYVLSVDRERGRIGLSLKRLSEDPWSVAEQEHYIGELVEVTIVGITKFGAFARLEDGLEGLIHISELADARIENPRDVVRTGQRITVEIIALDARRKRLGLSIRRVPEHLRQPLSELISQVAAEDQPAEGEASADRTAESGGNLAVDDTVAPESLPTGNAADDLTASGTSAALASRSDTVVHSGESDAARDDVVESQATQP